MNAQRISEAEKQSRASNLGRYRRRMSEVLTELRIAWTRYLEAIEEARALDRQSPADEQAATLIFWRECAERLVVVRMARVRQLLRQVREYREVIQIGESARSEMLPVLAMAA
jgi:hypothetical protein